MNFRKQVILSERKFDFLKDLVAHIPDVQANDEDGGDSNSDQGNRPRPRGRYRQLISVVFHLKVTFQK